MAKEDENNGKRIGRASNDPRGGHCQDEKNNMDGVSSHQERLLLFLMTIPVELLFVFMLSHFLSAFLDNASHNLPSFPFLQNLAIAFPLLLALLHRGRGKGVGGLINPQSHWFEFLAHRRALGSW
jgi:hypothetical protein